MIIYNWFKSLYYYLFIDKGFVNSFPYGFYIFCGRQGAGKTISAVKYIKDLKNKYNCKVFSNCYLSFADGSINDLSDLFTYCINYKNDNIVFFIDEIQNQFSCANSRNFDETILSLITQQRKNGVHIVGTSQVFGRVAKPLREQAFQVVDCKTYFGRCTINKWYWSDDYQDFLERSTESKNEKLHCIQKNSFFQTDETRANYNTFEVIEKVAFSKITLKNNIKIIN